MKATLIAAAFGLAALALPVSLAEAAVYQP